MTRHVVFPELKRDARGLVTVVAQDVRSGEVRMVAHANDEALERTLKTRVAHFYSRSRQRLWKKGEESGNTLRLVEAWVDCDADCVIYLVEPTGPSCHTGTPSCFFQRVDSEPGRPGARALPVLFQLEAELSTRTQASAKRSYTRSLLDGGAPKIGDKIREEAGELAEALASESDARVVSETADLVYHAMVGLLSRDVPLTDVMEELARRFDTSGHDEKASRGD